MSLEEISIPARPVLEAGICEAEKVLEKQDGEVE